MKYVIAAAGISIAFTAGAWAEPVLMLNEPRDIGAAEYSCDWAEGEIKSSQYLIKAFKCGESELCQRAIDINAACKVGGPIREVRAFHSKLLAQFASNPSRIRNCMNCKNDAANGRRRSLGECHLG